MSIDEIINERRWIEKCHKISLYHNERALTKRWRIQDSARELSLSVGFVSESITISKYTSALDLNRCKTREDALKIVRQAKL